LFKLKDCWSIWKTLIDCFLVWKINPKRGKQQPDLVGVFSFGFRKDGPGLSNIAMARLVERLSEKYNLPVISQWEVADGITRKRNLIEKIIREHRIKGEYLDTREVAIQMVAEMKKKGWKKIIIIAHSLHAWRCVKALEKLGIETIIPDELRMIPFDSKSKQRRTRNLFLWIIREIPTRLYFLLKGWI